MNRGCLHSNRIKSSVQEERVPRLPNSMTMKKYFKHNCSVLAKENLELTSYIFLKEEDPQICLRSPEQPKKPSSSKTWKFWNRGRKTVNLDNVFEQPRLLPLNGYFSQRTSFNDLDGPRIVIIEKDERYPCFGMSLERRDTHPGGAQKYYILSIDPDGLVAKQGSLKRGDQIDAVDGIYLETLSLNDVKALFGRKTKGPTVFELPQRAPKKLPLFSNIF